MRSTIVAGVGGLILGHVLWVVAISLAMKTTTVNEWVLVVGAVSLLVGVAGGLVGWMLHRRRAFPLAAFLWCLPISPVLLSLCVIGVTYL